MQPIPAATGWKSRDAIASEVSDHLEAKKITAEALKPTGSIAFRRIPSPFPAPGVNLKGVNL